MISRNIVSQKVYKSYRRQLTKKKNALTNYVKNKESLMSKNESDFKKNIFKEYSMLFSQRYMNDVENGETVSLSDFDVQLASLDEQLFESNRFKIKYKRVILNVGGARHEVLWKNLEKWPNSRLGKIRFAKKIEEVKELCDDVNFLENEIYFDRHASSFGVVLNFYRTGHLHLVEDVCSFSFHEDLVYWGVDECFLEDCCHLKYVQKKEAILEELKKEEEADKEDIEITEENFTGCCPSLNKKLWDLMVSLRKQVFKFQKKIIIFIS